VCVTHVYMSTKILTVFTSILDSMWESQADTSVS